jgi:N utilization substance protein B
MTTRRKAREWAVQFLFQREFNTGPLEEDLQDFWADKENDSARRFAEELIRGVLGHMGELDKAIQSCAENWNLARIGKVERNILRLAIYEMLYREDIPPVVSINEAVDISKEMSDDAAGRFVNGILDRVRKTLPRPARTPAPKDRRP